VEPAWYDVLAVHGFIDGDYARNGNAPLSHESFVPGTGTTAERADEFAINLVAIDLAVEPKPVGFHLALVGGNGAEVVHAGELDSSATGSKVYRHLYQASISYLAPIGRGVLFEAGVYPSHIGYESFYSKDNWNYTRSWLGEFSPYYQTGLKASYTFNGHWSAQVHLMNGWQIIADNNRGKSVGTQIAWSSDRLTASFNTFAGPELANDDKHLRVLGDLVATWKATRRLSVGTSIDRGHQALPGHLTASWLGVAGYARYALDDRRALAIRAEQFRDPRNGISGNAQTLAEGTVTLEYRPAAHLILKLEGRRDRSTAEVFARGSGHAQTQTIVVAGAVATF